MATTLTLDAVREMMGTEATHDEARTMLVDVLHELGIWTVEQVRRISPENWFSMVESAVDITRERMDQKTNNERGV